MSIQRASRSMPKSIQSQFHVMMESTLAPNTLRAIVSGSIPKPVAQMKVHQEIWVSAAA